MFFSRLCLAFLAITNILVEGAVFVTGSEDGAASMKSKHETVAAEGVDASLNLQLEMKPDLTAQPQQQNDAKTQQLESATDNQAPLENQPASLQPNDAKKQQLESATNNQAPKTTQPESLQAELQSALEELNNLTALHQQQNDTKKQQLESLRDEVKLGMLVDRQINEELSKSPEKIQKIPEFRDLEREIERVANDVIDIKQNLHDPELVANSIVEALDFKHELHDPERVANDMASSTMGEETEQAVKKEWKRQGEGAEHHNNTTKQELESSTQVEHNAAVKMTDGSAEPELVDIDHIDELVPERTPDTTSAVEVAADGSEVDVSTRSPSLEDSEAQPETQTKSTTEILVNPSGAIIVGNSAPAPEPSVPKARKGAHARRPANELVAGLHDSQTVSSDVLRKEPDMPTGNKEVSTMPSAVLRTEVTPAKALNETNQVGTAAAATEKVTEKKATMAEIRSVSQPALTSRGHRIPSSKPSVNVVVSTTTTAAALAIVEPEPVGWKHGLIPGILSHIQVKEESIINISIGIFLAIVAFGICSCRILAGKHAENPEVTGQVGRSQGSMYSGLSSVDFVDGEDAGVRAMLKRIWNARFKGPSMEAPTYPGGVETPTPTVLAKGQPESGMGVFLDPSLF